MLQLYLSSLSKSFETHWNPVGDNENNLAIINLGSDPAAGVTERITNAIDAVLEDEWVRKGRPINVFSPREAAEKWFNIPEGKVSNVVRIDDPKITAISDKVEVVLHDSERKDRPTVDVRDYGIGIRGEEFKDSILSLNKSRKLRKLYLAGAFGQGGSTALSYSTYTIIISRQQSRDNKKLNDVSFTIIRFNRGDLHTDKHGVYEYMVDHATGFPFTVDNVKEEIFKPGTLVRHISMDLGKYKSLMTAQTNSLWYLTHHYLFDPVLPFKIREQRDNKSNNENRSVGGNARLLTRSYNEKRHVEYMRSGKYNFREGRINVFWWVLSAEGDNAHNRITQYTLASQPIILTFNGQKQGYLPSTLINKDLRLPYLDGYLIVQVDCDSLDNESRRQLFPTTRESLRDTSLMEELRQLIVDVLAGDAELNRLDKARKQRYTQRGDSSSAENIRKRLANRVSTFTKTGGGKIPKQPNPTPGPDTPPTPGPNRIPIPVSEPPTRLEITNTPPREVYSGKRFTLSFLTDAESSYFNNPDAFIAVIDPPSFGQYTGTTSVKDGYGVAYFEAKDDQPAESTAKITLELRPKSAPSIRNEIEVVVVTPPTEGGNQPGKSKTPNINPYWVDEKHPIWKAKGWNEYTVAEVSQGDESIDVFVSSENKQLSALIERAQRKDLSVVDSIKDFYLEHISFHALIHHIDAERLEVPENVTDESKTSTLDSRELQRACQTVCGIMSDLFDLLAHHKSEIIESSESLSV